jgi:hypothetical protein
MKKLIGEVLAATIGLAGVLAVRGVVRLLEVANEMSLAWERRRALSRDAEND